MGRSQHVLHLIESHSLFESVLFQKLDSRSIVASSSPVMNEIWVLGTSPGGVPLSEVPIAHISPICISDLCPSVTSAPFFRVLQVKDLNLYH